MAICNMLLTGIGPLHGKQLGQISVDKRMGPISGRLASGRKGGPQYQEFYEGRLIRTGVGVS